MSTTFYSGSDPELIFFPARSRNARSGSDPEFIFNSAPSQNIVPFVVHLAKYDFTIVKKAIR